MLTDRTVTLTLDEIQALTDEVRHLHNVEDFEAECPACTAYRKLVSSAGSEAAAAKPTELLEYAKANLLSEWERVKDFYTEDARKARIQRMLADVEAALGGIGGGNIEAASLPPSPQPLIWQFSINKGVTWCECSAEHAAHAAKHGFMARALAVVSPSPQPSELQAIRERLQNSVNWMMEGRNTGLCPGVADFQVLIRLIDAAPQPSPEQEKRDA